ncbi:MAG: hypothetical protein IPK77_04925 [Cellvibrio sp.]|nr:hypothetical protein [Cellvibrio sp.]
MTVIERTLWFEEDEVRKQLNQTDLLNREEPLVILGEAGMGKSTLLKWIGNHPDYAFCTASQFINRHNPQTLIQNKRVLVIDALDEKAAQKDGDVLDQVLRKLGQINYPPFIISCRVADWRTVTASGAICEQYDEQPLVLHLEPFTKDQALQFLSSKFDSALSSKVVNHFSSLGLQDLLGNPQTLKLISKIAKTEILPETKREIFEKAVEKLYEEHNEHHARRQLVKESALNSSGAAFATLIFSGKDSISAKAITNLEDDEVSILEIRELPGASGIESAINSRLFKGIGGDRFTYIHKSIGEYLGARWLATLANTKRKRRRLLKLFHDKGIVPSSIRGIHAWLAIYPEFSEKVIAADPVGAIEYGDANSFDARQSRFLIDALESTANNHHQFLSWYDHTISGIFHPTSLERIDYLISSTAHPLRLRVLLIDSMVGVTGANFFSNSLIAIAKNIDEAPVCRRAACQVLSKSIPIEECAKIINDLYSQNTSESNRLAIEFSGDIEYQLIDDQLLVNLVIEHTKEENNVRGVLWHLETNFPPPRLGSLLDCLAVSAEQLGDPDDRPGNEGITDFAYQLIMRYLATSNTSAERLWSWLRPFNSNQGYRPESRQYINNFFKGNRELRNNIQKIVLFDKSNTNSIWEKAWELSRRSESLLPKTDEDIVFLLENIGDCKDMWRDVVNLISYNSEINHIVRKAAIPYCNTSEEIDWINNHRPKKTEWEIQHEIEVAERKNQRESVLITLRNDYAEHLEDIKSGHYGYLVNPAKAYLNIFSDLDRTIPVDKRISEWLGETVSDAVNIGFETYLFVEPLKPSPVEIVNSLLNNKSWDAGYIVIAALSERIRKGIGLDDLSSEKLVAGLFHLLILYVENRAEIGNIQKIIARILISRGLWKKTIRQYIEPQLKAGLNQVDGLELFCRDSEFSSQSTELIIEWLTTIPNLEQNAEIQLINCVFNSERPAELIPYLNSRIETSDSPTIRLTIDAIGIIIDFEKNKLRFENSTIDKDLIWYLRDYTYRRQNTQLKIPLESSQIEWIISTFRKIWPVSPSTRSSGDRNPSDASSYIFHLIQVLGHFIDQNSINSVIRLKNAEQDGYTEIIKSTAVEQKQKLVEATYRMSTVEEIKAIVSDATPASVSDLQEIILEELDIVQNKIKSDDIDSWKGFFDSNGVPFEEERCRDHLVGLLRQNVEGIELIPEAHLANDKEVDFICTTSKLRLPVEVKGQWHKELWHAADSQLDRLYAQDWQAEKRGIYLVLWFGSQVPSNKKLKGKNCLSPKTASELKEMLIANNECTKDGRVAVFVLDIDRSKPESS